MSWAETTNLCPNSHLPWRMLLCYLLWCHIKLQRKTFSGAHSSHTVWAADMMITQIVPFLVEKCVINIRNNQFVWQTINWSVNLLYNYTFKQLNHRGQHGKKHIKTSWYCDGRLFMRKKHFYFRKLLESSLYWTLYHHERFIPFTVWNDNQYKLQSCFISD